MHLQEDQSRDFGQISRFAAILCCLLHLLKLVGCFYPATGDFELCIWANPAVLLCNAQQFDGRSAPSRSVTDLEWRHWPSAAIEGLTNLRRYWTPKLQWLTKLRGLVGLADRLLPRSEVGHRHKLK